jgi:hypothetical protein
MSNNRIGLVAWGPLGLLGKMISVVFGMALMVVGSCTQAKDPADNSKPTVEIKVQEPGGVYTVMSNTTLSVNGSLKLSCNVTDPQGVKSGFLGFEGHSDSCAVDQYYDGGYWIKTMPVNISLPLQGDAQGNFLTGLPIYSDLNGPFTCTVPKPPCLADSQACMQGVPWGGVITVTCTGENWSANAQNQSATTTLTIKLN